MRGAPPRARHGRARRPPELVRSPDRQHWPGRVAWFDSRCREARDGVSRRKRRRLERSGPSKNDRFRIGMRSHGSWRDLYPQW